MMTGMGGMMAGMGGGFPGSGGFTTGAGGMEGGEGGDDGGGEECPPTQPEDESECEGGGAGGGLTCEYGTMTCSCGGGFMPEWSCFECPAEDPEDGGACEGFEGATCGDCDCPGFGDAEWDCGGGGF
jgi:hypothetical protein